MSSTLRCSTPCPAGQVGCVGQEAKHRFHAGPGQSSGEWRCGLVRPRSTPLACGRLGVRSPSRYGSRGDAARAGLGRERGLRQPGQVGADQVAAALDSTSPALTVHTSGRKRPVASAKPATEPEGSAAGTEVTANAVPRCRSTRRPRRVPGRGRVPRPCCRRCPPPPPHPSRSPPTSAGCATLGSSAGWPKRGRRRIGQPGPGRGREVAGAGGVAPVGDRVDPAAPPAAVTCLLVPVDRSRSLGPPRSRQVSQS